MSGVEEWAQFTIRCPGEMRRNAEASADAVGQSLAEWIRRAIQEKLDRESNLISEQITDDELDARIEAILIRKLEEKK